MDEHDRTDAARLRAAGAAEERAAILGIVERYVRRLAHGHGETGPHVLQQIVDEIRGRGDPAADAPAQPPAETGA
jgi:hypothetical protein